jgi:hypothetical protein
MRWKDRKPGGRKLLFAPLPCEQATHAPAPTCTCRDGKVLASDELFVDLTQ